jgi:TM2 domain-containing membrane protein YozV
MVDVLTPLPISRTWCPMSKNRSLATLLSLLVPGLGQIYAGKGERGAAILVAVIIVGNLNAIWLTLFPVRPATATFFAYTLPRVLHDLFAAYGVIFWIWQTADAYKQAK